MLFLRPTALSKMDTLTLLTGLHVRMGRKLLYIFPLLKPVLAAVPTNYDKNNNKKGMQN